MATLIVSLLIVLYSALAAPALPNSVILFFDTWFGKLLFMFLIAFVASNNIQVALVISILFFIILNLATQLELNKEYYEDKTKIDELDTDTKKFADWFFLNSDLNKRLTKYENQPLNIDREGDLLIGRNLLIAKYAKEANVSPIVIKNFFDKWGIEKDFSDKLISYTSKKDIGLANTLPNVSPSTNIF
jgi:hypothetical protein